MKGSEQRREGERKKGGGEGRREEGKGEVRSEGRR